MAIVTETEVKSPFLDKTEIQRIVAEQNERMGFVPDPTATAEKAQAMAAECLRAHGFRPEDNYLSRAIIATRDED